MDSPIIAIYESGVLRPLTPLPLPEQAEVQIYLCPVPHLPEAALTHRCRVREALATAGLSLSRPDAPSIRSSLSAERREELAHLFGTGRPLAELIVEERAGR
jgi:predicted DNA-binding antitoxin AbrB/MazE fold protein